VENEERRNLMTAKHSLLELLTAKNEKRNETRRKMWYTRGEAEKLFRSSSKRRVIPSSPSNQDARCETKRLQIPGFLREPRR